MEKNVNYYCAFYLGTKEISIFLHSPKNYKVDELNKKVISLNPIKDDDFIFYLGKDEKDNNFYKGKIGTFIIIKAPTKFEYENKNNKTKEKAKEKQKDSEIYKFISEILSLCESYKYFLISKSTENSKNYNIELKDYFWQNYFEEKVKILPKMFAKIDCLIYLDPINLQFYKNLLLFNKTYSDSESEKIPIIYEFGNKNLNFNITKLNVNIFCEEILIKLFISDNGINYFCLLFEYYNQFLRYYLLKKGNGNEKEKEREKEKEKIFEDNEMNDIIKDIIESIKMSILMLGNHSYSKYTYDASKKIWNNLYNCILNLNNIKPIIKEFVNELIIFKDINRDILLTYINMNQKNEKETISQNAKNEFDYNENNNFINYNKSYFIGIIEILLTPDFYKDYKNKDNLKFIDSFFTQITGEFKKVINLIDLSLIQNIFYKSLNLILTLNKYFSSHEKNKNQIIINEVKEEEKNKFIIIFEKIFRFIIEFLEEKTDEKNIQLAKDYFNQLFLFVFESNKKEYNIILAYLIIIKEEYKFKSSLKLNREQILLLKDFLLKLDKNQDKSDDNKIIIHDENVPKIQNLIICRIYEYLIATKKNKNEVIEINFLDEFLKVNKFTKELFIEIKNLLEFLCIDYFKIKKEINKNILPLPLHEKELKIVNNYFQNIFEFLKYLIKLLHNKDLIKENEEYLNCIYDILLKSQQSLKIQEANYFHYNIIYIINFIQFFYYSTNNSELNFIFQEEKIFEIIEELFDKCCELTLINYEYYFVLKDENITEKKLISEIFMDIYKNRLETIFQKYRLPTNCEKEVDKNDLNFIKNFNALIAQNLISEFNIENYDVKKITFLENSKSIFFDSDFLRLTLVKPYIKKYSKFKEIVQKMEMYNLMNGIIYILKPNFISLNNKFEFFHTTYFFYEIYDLCNNKLESYINVEEIKKHEDLKKLLEGTKVTLKKFKTILINDHLKLNAICKDYYSKHYQTNEIYFKNMLKSIQKIISIAFKKKQKNIDLDNLIKELETDFSNYQDKSSKAKTQNEIGNNSSTGSNPGQKNNDNIENRESIEGKKDKNYDFLFPQEIFGDIQKVIIFNENDNLKKDNNDIDNDINNLEENGEDLEKSVAQMKSLVTLIMNSPTKNILNKLDKYTIINPKKEFMKIIFGTYFSKSFYENDSFKKLRTIYLNTFNTPNPYTKLLNYPSKLKYFNDGLHPSLFLKENNKFFISKIFPITHEFYYQYMLKNNLLNESIILIKPNLSLEKNIDQNVKKLNCELIKTDKFYYGQIINLEKEKFFYFTKETFELFDKAKDADTIIKELNERGFSLSSLKFLETPATIKARKAAINDLMDNDIFPDEDFNSKKTVIIFYDEIEEIVEKRFLFLWQGFEIFLKNGKSYMFNMITKENYEEIIKSLKSIPNIIFREKDFMLNTQDITLLWKNKKLETYDYLLYCNKYSSRSFNDLNQYYIFPWILRDFTNLTEITEKEEEIYEVKTKKNKNNVDENIKKLLKNFRDLNYPVSAQEKQHRETKREKFNDEDEKFKCHHGTHYATSSYVDYFLMRNEPFTTLLVELQNYVQEDPNRLLMRLKDTIAIINSGYDNRELIPEIYSKIDFFINVNCCFYGYKKNKELVDDIDAVWEINKYKKLTEDKKITNYAEFILAHRKLLNSNVISAEINIWIDNVFGCKQFPAKKIEKSINIFPKSTYEKFVNLHEKLKKLAIKYEGNSDRILKKFINKINVITSFGECPYIIFKKKHEKRELKNENEKKEEENAVDDYDDDDDKNIVENDFLHTYIKGELKNDEISEDVKINGFYFEVNQLNDKIFILSESNMISIIHTNFYRFSSQTKYNFDKTEEFSLPHICLLNKIKISDNNYYYIYNIKYAFSSFPKDKNNSCRYLYSNNYLDNMKNFQINNENKFETIKFITCRHLDNSFKLHYINIKDKKIKDKESYSFICEDFVMCCKVIDHDSFIIGLHNGKLIKVILNEINIPLDKNKKNLSRKFDIVFEKYITGHIGSVNVLEIDKKNGIILTGGDDNKLFIRKLYDFELLTSIQFKEKYIITMIKVSPTDLLYIMCFDKNKGKSVIFGYSLSGLKFAKSDYSYYKNIEFTRNGNIILLDNSDLKLLYGHNLKEIVINEKDSDFKKFNEIKMNFNSEYSSVGWIQFNDFKNYYGVDRSIISLISKEQNKKFYTLKTLVTTKISYFE